MRRIVTWIVVLAVGASLGYLLGRPGDANLTPATPARPASAPAQIDYQPPAPKVSAAEAASHRESLYADLGSVDDVMSLPTDFAQTEALFALAGRADARTLEAYIADAERIAHRWDRRGALHILFLRYVELDAPRAVAHLESMRLDIDMQIMDQMYQSWSKVDLNAAIDSANALTNPQRRKRAGAAILRAYTLDDPGMLPQIAASLTDTHELAQFESEALVVSANHAPQAALQRALMLTDVNGRGSAISQVGHVWARQDPVAALAAADTIPDAQQRRLYRQAVIGRWAGDDPDAAMSAVLAIPASGERDDLLGTAIGQLAASNPDAALAVAQRLTGGSRQAAYQALFRGWAESDPRAAARGLESLADRRLREQLLHNVAWRYARVDPEGALAWVSSVDAPRHSGLWENVIGAIAQADPQRAVDLVLQGGDRDYPDHVLPTAIMSLAQVDPALAVSYVDRLPDGQPRDQAYAQIASSWASRDLESALNWAERLSGPAYDQAMREIASQTAWNDPDTAARYLARIRGPARANWIGKIAEAYAYNDAQRAITWLSQFEGEGGYAGALQQVVPRLAQQAPDQALALARSLPVEQRGYTVQNTLEIWSSRDPAAAARWAQQSATAEERSGAMQTVVHNWIERDRTAALRFVDGLPSGPDTDGAIMAAVANPGLSVSQRDALLDRIVSDDTRNRAVAQVYLVMLSRDPESARQFLDSADISEEWRQRLSQRALRFGGR